MWFLVSQVTGLYELRSFTTVLHGRGLRISYQHGPLQSIGSKPPKHQAKSGEGAPSLAFHHFLTMTQANGPVSTLIALDNTEKEDDIEQGSTSSPL